MFHSNLESYSHSSQDPLAKEIINRVDNSPYGIKGRKPENDIYNSSKGSPAHIPEANLCSTSFDLKSTQYV